jgi:glucose-1-phosphate thymidylyltransferase
MKGILLAGGSGTRLYPATKSLSKQLLPIYDKPTIYYPLSTLMLAGLQEILVISTPRDLPVIKNLLGDGKQWGIQISFAEQAKPEGIAQAFIIAKQFLNNQAACLILGDNIFYGHDVTKQLESAVAKDKGATIFAYQVNDPKRYGVVASDAQGNILSIEEKPAEPKSNWAVTGLYCFDGSVCDKAAKLKPSKRNELEITDLIKSYLTEKNLHLERLGRGVAWLDSGTPESLVSATQFVQSLEVRQGLKIACLEEIAFSKGFLSKKEFLNLAEQMPDSEYGLYVKRLAMDL